MPIPTVDDYVDDLISTAPSLTPAQRDRLRQLLAGRRPVRPNDLRRELRFREHQASMRRRISASRRMEPLADGTTDPLAPGGRWSA